MNKNIFNFIKTPEEDTHSVKRNTKFYLSIFKNNKIGEWFPSWNWACFFTSFIGLEFAWLFYRRMYFYGILIGLVGVTAFELIRVKLGLFLVMHMGIVVGKSIMWLMKITWVFTFTVYGNSLYGKNIFKNMDNEKAKKGTDPYTPLVVVFFVYAIGTYAIMKFMQGNLDGSGVQDILTQLASKNAN